MTQLLYIHHNIQKRSKHLQIYNINCRSFRSWLRQPTVFM